MNDYPDVVAKIVTDYSERLKSQLRMAPVQDQNDFLREIQSHIYEAYHQEDSAPDEVSRILRVLRHLGEPAEVVADRLPEAMVRSGATPDLPLRILGGILIAFFGVPLAFSGVAVVMGTFIALAGVIISYYAAAGVLLLASAMSMILGVSRFYQPELLDRLIGAGVITMNVQLAEVMDRLSPSAQGNLLIFFAIASAAVALAMLWSGRYLVRGLRFLVSLVVDQIRQLASRLRRRAKAASSHLVDRLQGA